MEVEGVPLVYMGLTGGSVAGWWCGVDGLGVTLPGRVEMEGSYG